MIGSVLLQNSAYAKIPLAGSIRVFHAAAAPVLVAQAAGSFHMDNTYPTGTTTDTLYFFTTWHGPKACAKRTGAAADMSASPEQGEACELAGVTRARQARPSSARMCTRAYGENIPN